MATINSKIEGVDVLGVVTAGETIYVGRATSTQHGIVKPAATDFEFDNQTNAMLIKLGTGLKRTDDGIAIAIYDGNVVTDVTAEEDGLKITYTDVDEETSVSKIISWSEFTAAEIEYLKKYFNIEPGTGEGAVQQIGAKATGKQAAAFGGLRYDKQTGRTPTSADGNQSFAAGGSVHAEGDFSAAFGKDTIARQRASFAAGSSIAGMTEDEFNAFFWDSTNNVGLHGGSKNKQGQICDFTGAIYANSFAFSSALGCDCEAKGPRSFAAGDNAKATNTGAVAVGARTTASGSNSTATGADTKASGERSFAANQFTEASGYNSAAFGLNTKATGNHSMALGEETETSAPGAVAEGYKTKASGAHSHAGGGQFTEAAGFNAFAYGANVHADAENSVAFGYETVAKSPNETVVGKNNVLRTDVYFQVGNGTDWNNRNDAFTVYKDGRAEIGSAPTTEKGVVRLADLGYEVDFPSGEHSITYDATENGLTITGTMRLYLNSTKTVYHDIPNVSVSVPIKAIAPLKMDKAAGGEFVEIGIDKSSEIHMASNGDDTAMRSSDFSATHTAASGYTTTKLTSAGITKTEFKLTQGQPTTDTYEYLHQGNVKTLFGNQQSIYGTGNIDLYKHNVIISQGSTESDRMCVYCQILSPESANINSLTLFKEYIKDDNEFIPATGKLKLYSGDAGSVIGGVCKAGAIEYNMHGKYTNKIDFSSSWATINAAGSLTFYDTVTTV